MRARRLEIRVIPFKEEMEEEARAIREMMAGKKQKPRQTLSFESFESMRSLLTPQRHLLLRVIRRKEPKSVYELSKLLGRDRKAVTLDLQVLERLGLVEFHKTTVGGRVRSVPSTPYSSVHIDVEF